MTSGIGVVIPCFNQGMFLPECLGSILDSTLRPDEVCVVDDGSTDRYTIEVLRSISRLYPIARVVHQENRGLAAARNCGIRETRSDFVHFLDADDRVDPAALALMREYLAQCPPEVAYVYPESWEFQNRDMFIEFPGETNPYRFFHENTHVYSVLIRRSVLARGFEFDESMRQGFEDWELWLRLGLAGYFGRKAPGAIFRYRKRGYSMVSRARSIQDRIVGDIRSRNGLDDGERAAALKLRWMPAVGFIAAVSGLESQTFQDHAMLSGARPGPAGAAPGAVASFAADGFKRASSTALERAVMAHYGLNAAGATWIESDGATCGALINYRFWLDWNAGIRQAPSQTVVSIDGLPPDGRAADLRSSVAKLSARHERRRSRPAFLPASTQFLPIPDHADFSATLAPQFPKMRGMGPVLIADAGVDCRQLGRPVSRTIWLGTDTPPAMLRAISDVWEIDQLGVGNVGSFLREISERWRPISIHFACGAEVLRSLPDIVQASPTSKRIVDLAASPGSALEDVADHWDNLIHEYRIFPWQREQLIDLYVSPTKIRVVESAGVAA